MTTQDYINDLYSIADSLGLRNHASVILTQPRFLHQSGSLHSTAHHHGVGGLVKHIWEVVKLAMQTAEFFRSEHHIDLQILFLAALYHDYGKCWDYAYDLVKNEFIDSPDNHRRKIHHISRSAIEWEIIAREVQPKLSRECRDAVTHCILSHHGHRDYGSPVHPFSREAWILHLSDNMSARCNDCDRIDMLKINKNK